MAHAVSASYARSDHMPPVAALLAALLHAATALALFWISPLNQPNRDVGDDAIQVTFGEPKEEPKPPVQEAVQRPTPPPPPPAAEAKPAEPPPAAAAKPEAKSQPQAKSNEPLGVSRPPPEAKKPDEHKPEPPQEAKLEPLKPAEPKSQSQQEATVEPTKPAEPTPQPQREAASTLSPEPAPPPEPPLEKVVPPVEAPPAPLTMRDFVKVLPPVPRPAPPQQHHQPPPKQHTLQRSPLSTAPAPPQSSSGAVVSTFVNPAAAGGQTRAKDAYLWQVIRKFSQYLPDLRDKHEGGTVVLRFVIARDGRLVEASVAKSSGVMALDRGLLESLRAAAPYPPLPPEIPGSQVVFVQPIAAKR